MSDGAKRALGILLIAACVCACVLGTLRGARPDGSLSADASGRKGTVLLPEPPRGTLNVNLADAEELTAFPGIGETIAARIVTEREQNGPFHYPEDLMTVSGIGRSKLDGMLPLMEITETEGEN